MPLPARSYADQIRDLQRVFKLKRIFTAWRETRSYIDKFEDSFERVLSLRDSSNGKQRKRSALKRTYQE